MARPSVVVITGLPGTGKSTLAEGLARGWGAPAFSGDWLLGALAPYGVLTDLPRATSLALYRSLLGSLWVRQVMLDQSAVLDCIVDDATVASWRNSDAAAGARLWFIECVCSDAAVHQRRVTGRVRGIPGWHEIDWAHVERMRAEQPPLRRPDLVVDSIDEVGHNILAVRRLLGLDQPDAR